MESEDKKHAAALGIRIGFSFLAAIAIIILVTYFTLSQNFQRLMTDYSIQLVQAMARQGVEIVENELETSLNEAAVLAASFAMPFSDGQTAAFPTLPNQTDLRMVYVSKTQTIASDGHKRSIENRPDIITAFQGEAAIYGPYYNEEKEYVICYSAPIIQNNQVIGVLSIEKDGYRFCKLIESIQFADSGESYIINAAGTDIAVSRQEHIEWVTSEYNAEKLLAQQEDPVTRSIYELEQKGLNGESGVGTYYWNDGLVYVIYEPVANVNWVLLAGLREEEIYAMTQSALFTSISKGPVIIIGLLIIFLLTGLIIFWIVASMKKNAEINEKLELIANHDSLTGLLNRRFLETSLSELWKYPIRVSGQAAVFMMDIDDFKKYNDYYGHLKGDECLRQIASIFRNSFDGYDGNVMRYGGEEFIAVIFALDKDASLKLGQQVCQLVEREKLPNSSGGVVTVSVGVCHANTTLEASLYECIQIADKALYQAKKEGKNRAVLLNTLQEEADCRGFYVD